MAAQMKMQWKTAFALLTGVGLGITAVRGLQGGQAKAPPAYVISNIEVIDPVKYQKYAEASVGIVGNYNGKILARGGRTVVFDGRTPQRVILIEFASMADAQRWRSSAEFQKLKSLQQQSSTYIESFAIEGAQ
jgi:uncharacterized protein (DUF1330 family)